MVSEARLHRDTFDPAAEVLLAAMAWAQGTLTGAWPEGTWWRSFMGQPPEGWISRLFWHASWSQASRSGTPAHNRHRRRLVAAAAEGGDHPLALLF